MKLKDSCSDSDRPTILSKEDHNNTFKGQLIINKIRKSVSRCIRALAALIWPSNSNLGQSKGVDNSQIQLLLDSNLV